MLAQPMLATQPPLLPHNVLLVQSKRPLRFLVPVGNSWSQ